MDIYYWKYNVYMLGKIPTKEEFNSDYVKLPIDITAIKMSNGYTWIREGDIEHTFNVLNDETNPLSSKENQKWIGENLKPNPHTSMSVGDIIHTNKTYWIAKFKGWKKLWED